MFMLNFFWSSQYIGFLAKTFLSESPFEKVDFVINDCLDGVKPDLLISFMVEAGFYSLEWVRGFDSYFLEESFDILDTFDESIFILVGTF